jgi:hypothetical protein
MTGMSLLPAPVSRSLAVLISTIYSCRPRFKSSQRTKYPLKPTSDPISASNSCTSRIETFQLNKQRPAVLTIRTPLIRPLHATHIHASDQTIPSPLHLCQQPATQRPGLEDFDTGGGEPRVPPEFQFEGVGSWQGVGFVLDTRGPGLCGRGTARSGWEARRTEISFVRQRGCFDQQAGQGTGGALT